MIFRPFYYYDTGCAAYLFGCGTLGKCAVVDPRTDDVDAYAAFAHEKGHAHHARDRHARPRRPPLGRAGAGAAGRRAVLPARVGRRRPSRSSRCETARPSSSATRASRSCTRPGHSPESICLLVTDLRRGADPWFVLTGDTLFVGAVGRPDLPGHARENAARALRQPPRQAAHAARRRRGLSRPLLRVGLRRRPERQADRAPSRSRSAGTRCCRSIATRSSTRSPTCPPKPAEMEQILAFNRGLDRQRPTRDERASRRSHAIATSGSACARTSRSSRCSSSSTPSSARWSAWSAASCPRSPSRSSTSRRGPPSCRSSSCSASRRRCTNYAAGRLSDRFGRKQVLVAGWLVRRARALPADVGAELELDAVAPTLLLGVSQGLTWSTTVIMKIDLVGAEAARARDGAQRVRRLLRRRGERAGDRLDRRRATGCGPSRSISASCSSSSGSRCRCSSSARRRTTSRTSRALRGALPPERADTARGVLAHDAARPQPVEREPGRPRQQPERRHGVGPLPAVLRRGRAWTSAQIGMLAAIYPATWGIAQLFTGALSDRIGPEVADRGRHVGAGRRHRRRGRCRARFAGFAAGAVLLGLGTAMVYPTLLAAIGDVAHPSWRASAVGVYRLWRDLGYAVGALLAGVTADAFGLGCGDVGRRGAHVRVRPRRGRAHERDAAGAGRTSTGRRPCSHRRNGRAPRLTAARYRFYQITRTLPEARIASSRVMSGSPRSRAAATIKASNGSRVKRNSSASKTWAAVRSCGW